MLKNPLKILSLALLLNALNAQGYKIPALSYDSLGLSGSNIAKSFGADAARQNPANMMFLEDKSLMQLDLSYVSVDGIKFKNELADPSDETWHFSDASSKSYGSFLGSLFYVSPEIASRIKLGFSLGVPAALKVGWNEIYPQNTAKYADFRAIEFNPSLAVKIYDNLSLAAGFRAIQSKGRFDISLYTYSKALKDLGMSPFNFLNRSINGSGYNYGYNLALSFNPNENLSLASTYRSKVLLKINGKENVDYTILTKNVPPSNPPMIISPIKGQISLDSSFALVLPAELNIALAYEWEKYTFLFNYERVFWSALKELRAKYSKEELLPDVFFAIIKKPYKIKTKDANNFKFGLKYALNQDLNLLGGFAYYGAHIKDDGVDFVSPDMPIQTYSAGLDYSFNSDFQMGFSYAFANRQSRKVNTKGEHFGNTLKGQLKSARAHLASVSFKYKF